MIDPAVHDRAVERMAIALQRSYYHRGDKFGVVTWNDLAEARKERWRDVARCAFVQTYEIAKEITNEHITIIPLR